MSNRAMMDVRLDRLITALANGNLDCVALVPGAGFYYLTGVQLHLMERPTMLFVGRDHALHAIIPSLEKTRWQAEMPDVETEYWCDSDGFDAAFARVADKTGFRKLGVEGQRMRVFESDALRRYFGADAVIDAQQLIAGIRMLKDEAETALQRKAISISEEALAATLEKVQSGMTERKIQQMLQISMLEHGADGFGFEPIVLTGAMTADPHGVSSHERQLTPGDPILIDFGALYGGYSADITRTVFCRHARSEHREIHAVVQAANTRGREIAGPAITAHELDTAVTDILRRSPFPELIVHKTGHGLGLDIHEGPHLMEGNHTQLLPRMTCTIEPGLYRTGDIGVRIEDDVLITADGCISLTEFSRDPLCVGD
jgi:Xaa-Pro aminopeptidase